MLTHLETVQQEIIAPSDEVDIYLRRSPLRQEREHHRLPAGLSLAEIVDHLGFEHKRLYITINGHAIERKNWSRIRVKPGANVTIVTLPGKGAIRSLIGAVVAIAAAIFAPYLAGPLVSAFSLSGAAAASVTGLIAAGLTIAGTLALNALFPVAKPQSLSDNTKTLYSIGGAQNEAAQYGAVPEIFGTHRVSPPYAAGPYTEVSGDDQYLRLLFCVGYGPVSISDLKIAETPISTFEGVTYEVIADHTVQAPTLYTKPVYEESVSVLIDNPSHYVQRTTADNVDEVSVDISFPNGVYRYQADDGKKINYTVSIEAQIAPAGTGAWVTFGNVTITSDSAQAIRRSLSVVVARGKYDVRLWKTTLDYSGDDTVAESAYWTALRSRRNEPVVNFSKPLTLIALRIKATNELNGTVNQLNCIATPLIPGWNGISWLPGQATRNPADHFRHVLQGNANARPVPDAAIDLESIQAWHTFCYIQGFTHDLVATDQQSVYDRLTAIAAAGRASVTFRDGRWGVVWDSGETDIVQHFTPRNSSGFSSVRAYADLPHGFRVNFINRDNGYLNDERVVYDDGYSAANATKFEGLDFPGVTDPNLIWRHGRYHIAQLRLQREVYSLSTDFEHLVCTRGDRVRVNHDVVRWGLGSARVKSIGTSPQSVTLDDTLTMQAGKTYSLRFRLADGTSLVRTVAGVNGDFQHFVFSDAGALPDVGDLAMFGENGMESVVLRVKSIMPQADLSAKLELVDDAPAIINADKGAIPAFQTGMPPLIDYRTYRPTALAAVESIWTSSPPTSAFALSWSAPEVGQVTQYIVQYATKGTDNWSPSITVSAPQAELKGLNPGSYSVRVRAVLDNDQLSGWLSGTITASIFASAPNDVTGFNIAVTGDLATFQWDNPTDPKISHYEIRYSPLYTATWQTSSLLRSPVYGQQVQLPLVKGAYLIKPVSFAGIQAANASKIINTIDALTSFNAVEAVTEMPPFSGVKEGTFFDGSALRLDVGSDFFAPIDFFEDGDYFLQKVGYLRSGYYYLNTPIDLGDVYNSRISCEIHALGEWSSDDFFALTDVFNRSDFFGDVGSLWDVSVEMATTNDAVSGAPAWSDWLPFVTGDVSARSYKFRARLQSRQLDVTPLVTSLTVSVDMPDRVTAGNDIDVPPGGATISFQPPYKRLQGVSIAAQGLAAGDFYLITAKDEAGFHIEFKDSAGAPIARTFDYVAKGYGAVQ